jgi:hypothetical protein
METLRTIQARPSAIRRYTAEKIDGETIRKVLEAGMAAPSAGNQQPWHFIVLDDRTVLDAVPEHHPHSSMIREAPVAILVCGDISAEKHQGYWVQDCAAATQNMLLAVTDLGLGAVWLGVYPRGRVRGLRDFSVCPNTSSRSHDTDSAARRRRNRRQTIRLADEFIITAVRCNARGRPIRARARVPLAPLPLFPRSRPNTAAHIGADEDGRDDHDQKAEHAELALELSSVRASLARERRNSRDTPKGDADERRETVDCDKPGKADETRDAGRRENGRTETGHEARREYHPFPVPLRTTPHRFVAIGSKIRATNFKRRKRSPNSLPRYTSVLSPMKLRPLRQWSLDGHRCIQGRK